MTASNSAMWKTAQKNSTTGVLRGKVLALNSLDVDGLLTAQATIAAETTYVTADFDGALVTPGGSGRFAVPRNVTVSTTSHAGAYHIVSPIVVTGIRAWDGVPTSESLYLTAVDGPETITGVVMFSQITSVLVPAQHDTSGTISVGCGTAAMAVGSCTGVVTANTVSSDVYTMGNNHSNTGGGARGLYVGTASSAHVYVMHWEDEVVTPYLNVSAGELYPFWIKSIHEGTTATDLVACK